MSRGAAALLLVALAVPLAAQRAPKVTRVEAQPRRPTLHVIAVGIDDYAPGPSLRGAVADVTALSDALAEFGKPLFDVDLIRITNRQATGAAVSGVVARVVRTARPEDLFVFQFAGNGIELASDSEPFLMLSGAFAAGGTIDTGAVRRTGIPPRLFKTWLDALPCRNQVIVIDAAYGAQFFNRLTASDSAARRSDPGASAANVNAFTLWERSKELPVSELPAGPRRFARGEYHGVLTWSILSALVDAASKKRGGVIRVHDVVQSARQNAMFLSRGKTTPLVYVGGRDFPLGTDGSPAADSLARLIVARAERPDSALRISVDPIVPTIIIAGDVSRALGGKAFSLGARMVLVNDQPAELDSAGRFVARLPATEDLDRIRIRAEDDSGHWRDTTIALAVSRGFGAPPRRAATPGPPNAHHMALLFATNQYDSGWTHLNNPVVDARALRDELARAYGFDVHLVTDPTVEQIRDSLLFYSKRQFSDADQLLIFFAGHGNYDSTRVLDGYLVARNTKRPDHDDMMDSAIKYAWLRYLLIRSTAKHVLLILDVCYGGSFDERIAGVSTRSDEYADVDRDTYISRHVGLTTRRYLTSGGNQRVPDGQPERHSPFARKLLDFLGTGEQHSYLTFMDLLSALQVVNPTPRAGEFGRNDPGSDFVFIRTTAPPRQ
jgi:uncharacterized caspase-like protein